MVCATARRDPSRAYFEFDAQPDQRIEYTIRLDMASMIKRPRLNVVSSAGIGRGAQIIRARVSAIVGIVINSIVEEIVGRRGSLMNSFTPSAMG